MPASHGDDLLHVPETRTSGKAIASLVMGVLSLVLPLILSIAAIIVGILGFKEIRRSGGLIVGRGMALTGIISGTLTLLACPVIIAVLIPGIQKIRTEAAGLQSVANLNRMGEAMLDHHRRTTKLPPAATYDRRDWKPLLSWRVFLLPDLKLQEGNLFSEFNLSEPWNSPHNSKLISRMPKVYGYPGDTESQEKGLTYYRVLVATEPGPRGELPIFGDLRTPLLETRWEGKTFFLRGPPPNSGMIQDGTANTILVAEASEPVPWTKPHELIYSPNQPLPKLGVVGTRFNVLMADGTVYRLDHDQVSEQSLRHAILRNDGNKLGTDWPIATTRPPAEDKK